jgi:hypothetical protein
MRNPDARVTAGKLAVEASPEALNEILAVRFFNMFPEQTPILAESFKGDNYKWLIANKIVKREVVEGWPRRKWLRPRLTQLGELVLLSAATDALRKIGRLPPEEDPTHG